MMKRDLSEQNKSSTILYTKCL